MRAPAGAIADAAWYAATVSCRAACPVGTDAAGYVQAVADGRFAEAYDLARATNPFPSVCGRICSAPCETACRRGVLDAPIAIRAVKRMACDAFTDASARTARWHRAHGAVPAATRSSVGIVGAGPAGLAAALVLRLAGHAVTLYDAEREAGGLMLWGIPAFRLPRRLVREEVGAVLSLGIDFVGACRIGADLSLDELRARHAAVLLAHGCAHGRRLAVDGQALDGVRTALDVLSDFNHARPLRIVAPVVVIGGGSVAFDAARAAQRVMVEQGASAPASHMQPTAPLVPGVQLIAPEPYDLLPVPHEELRDAAAEGVVVRAGLGVRAITGEHRVTGVRLAPVVSLRDAEGRFTPVLATDREEQIAAATVILAIGQVADEALLSGLGPTRRDGRTDVPQLYMAGDVADGPGDLIDAIASGQRVARRILADLGTAGPPPSPTGVAPVQPERVTLRRRYWSGYDTVTRRALPVLDPAARGPATEVEQTLDRREAQREASRCLLCDTHVMLDASQCIGCGLCVDVCPYGCLTLTTASADGDAGPASFTLTLDEASCIRCGLCIDRCPPRALELQRV